MTRVKRGPIAKKRRKKIIKLTEGFRGSHSRLFATANQQFMKAFRYSYFDRKKNKNEFRKLWIQRINGLSRSFGVKYNELIKKIKSQKLLLNRKMLAKIALEDPNTFRTISEKL